jgi:hypothetical protein
MVANHTIENEHDIETPNILLTRSSKSKTVSSRMQFTAFMIERAIIMSRKSFFYHHGFVMW